MACGYGDEVGFAFLLFLILILLILGLSFLC